MITLASILNFLAENKSVIIVVVTSAAGSFFGAWIAASLIARRFQRADDRAALADANVAIADMVALLGKLINFKKDRAFPANADAEKFRAVMDGTEKNTGQEKFSIKLDLWPELPLSLSVPADRLFHATAADLDIVQLVKTLESNLSELKHLLSERNRLIRQMNTHQAGKGQLPVDGLRLYLDYCARIARNTDENLFFIDRAIEKIRMAAAKRLPRSMQANIATVGLRTEAEPLMPPKDLIKGWIKHP